MAGITFLLALILYIDAFVRSTPPRLGKLAACILLAFYATYYYFLF